MNKRETPSQMCNNKHAILFYKLISTEIPQLDWLDLNFQQYFNQRDQTYKIFKANTYKEGCNNIISNRLNILNMKIAITSVGQSIDSFKVLCKNLLLG